MPPAGISPPQPVPHAWPPWDITMTLREAQWSLCRRWRCWPSKRWLLSSRSRSSNSTAWQYLLPMTASRQTPKNLVLKISPRKHSLVIFPVPGHKACWCLECLTLKSKINADHSTDFYIFKNTIKIQELKYCLAYPKTSTSISRHMHFRSKWFSNLITWSDDTNIKSSYARQNLPAWRH